MITFLPNFAGTAKALGRSTTAPAVSSTTTAAAMASPATATGMISHKMSLIRIFGHKHKISNQKCYYFTLSNCPVVWNKHHRVENSKN